MSGKKANNNTGLYSIVGKNLVLAAALESEINSPACMCTTKISPPCQMPITHPAFYLSSYNLPRHPQGQITSNKLLSRTISCELVVDFISTYPSTPRDTIVPHSMPGRYLAARRAFRFTWLSEEIRVSLVYHSFEFHKHRPI